MFNKFDVNRSGTLTLFEIFKMFRSVGLEMDYKDIFSLFHHKSNKVIFGVGEELNL